MLGAEVPAPQREVETEASAPLTTSCLLWFWLVASFYLGSLIIDVVSNLEALCVFCKIAWQTGKRK